MEGLKNEIEGKFEEAAKIYKKNSFGYDFSRVEKLSNEIMKQMDKETFLEFNDLSTSTINNK